MEVREATASDAPAVHKLYEILTNNVHVNVEPSRIETIANDSNNFLFVICMNGQVQGTCFVTLCLDPMFGDQPYGVIENVVVSPESRNLGLGQNMLKHVELFCLNRNCSKIMLHSTTSRDAAHGFFKSIGYDNNRKSAFVKYRSNFINE